MSSQVVLTESADFLMLTSFSILTDPTAYSLAAGNSGNDVSSGCMTSGYLCLQLWTVETSDVPCPTDLSGSYSFQYTADCNSAVSGYSDAATTCADYKATYDTSITLSADLAWTDNLCDPILFEVEFDAAITFYTDNTFSTSLDQSGGDQYQLGDQAYVEVCCLLLLSRESK